MIGDAVFVVLNGVHPPYSEVCLVCRKPRPWLNLKRKKDQSLELKPLEMCKEGLLKSLLHEQCSPHPGF